jgi:hypothetical protein
MEFKDLLAKHDYYCSESNYHSNESGETHEDWESFYNEWKDADIDMNLVFRWDIKTDEDSGGYFMNVFIMQQRKGIFYPVLIENIVESDFNSIVSFLTPHFNKLKSIWYPFK